jgi:muramoyltetrapeptide carboxypeptidase
MIKPPLLHAGDLVAITAPARKVSQSDLTAALAILKSWDLNVILSQNLFSGAHSYLAGTDNERLYDLDVLINNPEVKSIFCARGGYGSTRIIDQIKISSLIKNPKWIIGFSDITAIHLALLHNDIMSIHATMPLLFSEVDSSKTSVESLRSTLFEGSVSINTSPNSSNRRGSGVGKVVGGNLSLVVDSLSTPSEIETDQSILVIEEIDEYFYRIDRMMTHLKRAGKLDNLAGLIVGHMTDIKESTLQFGESVEEIVLNKVKEFNYPVVFRFPSGHENPNLAWIQGETCRLTVDDKSVSLISLNTKANS